MSDIRVLIADDQQLVREGIASLLALQENVEVVGTAANGKECVARARELKPDVILMDIRMPVMDGIAAVSAIRELDSEVRILMLTTFDDQEYVMKSLRAGAAGYLLKDLPIDDLARAVVQAAGGTAQMASEALDALMGMTAGGEAAVKEPDSELSEIWDRLSERERGVLRLIGRGATNREIADSLHLSEGTVKNYVSTLLATFEFRDRVEGGAGGGAFRLGPLRREIASNPGSLVAALPPSL